MYITTATSPCDVTQYCVNYGMSAKYSLVKTVFDLPFSVVAPQLRPCAPLAGTAVQQGVWIFCGNHVGL